MSNNESLSKNKLNPSFLAVLMSFSISVIQHGVDVPIGCVAKCINGNVQNDLPLNSVSLILFLFYIIPPF